MRMNQETPEEAVHRGRALVLADLAACEAAGPAEVSALETAMEHRRWWCAQWPQGAPFLPGLLAQDVQDALLDAHGAAGRWPVCPFCEDHHALDLEPELSDAPHWVCGARGRTVAPLGGLDRAGEADGTP